MPTHLAPSYSVNPTNGDGYLPYNKPVSMHGRAGQQRLRWAGWQRRWQRQCKPRAQQLHGGWCWMVPFRIAAARPNARYQLHCLLLWLQVAIMDWMARTDIQEEFVLVIDVDMIIRSPLLPQVGAAAAQPAGGSTGSSTGCTTSTASTNRQQ